MFINSGIVSTVDVKTAFDKIDYCIMVGAFPRLPGMERKDLLQKNAGIFKEQGKALSDYANRNVKVNYTQKLMSLNEDLRSECDNLYLFFCIT
jgi:malate/lactate dehydrogenase